MANINLSDREIAIILAVLRTYQIYQDKAQRNLALVDIVTNNGEFPLPDLKEIDELCERINR